MMRTAKTNKPLTVLSAITLGYIEAGLVALLSVFILISGLQESHFAPMSTIMLSIFFLLIAIFIALAAHMLTQRKSSGRSLLLVWQLFLFVIGLQAFFGGQLLGGLIATVLALVVIITVLSHPTHLYLQQSHH